MRSHVWPHIQELWDDQFPASSWHLSEINREAGMFLWQWWEPNVSEWSAGSLAGVKGGGVLPTSIPLRLERSGPGGGWA